MKFIKITLVVLILLSCGYVYAGLNRDLRRTFPVLPFWAGRTSTAVVSGTGFTYTFPITLE
jgi:hypothetical protein